MDSRQLPASCIEIIRWLGHRPAERAIGLGDCCGVLTDLIESSPSVSIKQWAERFRILDDAGAIIVQLFTGNLHATSFFEGAFGLYTQWGSAIARTWTAHTWDHIVGMARPDYKYRKTLVRGDMRSCLERCYDKIMAETPGVARPKDIYRICRPRIAMTEKGRAVLAWADETNIKSTNNEKAIPTPTLTKSRPDLRDYRLVSKLMSEFPIEGVITVRERVHFLDSHTEIRVEKKGRRLWVNVSDWLRVRDALANGASGGDGNQEPSPGEIEQMKRELREGSSIRRLQN